MQSKTRMSVMYSLEWLELERLILSTANEDMEWPALTHFCWVSYNGTSDYLSISYKFEHIIIR